MGKVGKAITKPFRKIGKAVGGIFGLGRQQSSQTVDYSTGAAAAPATDATNNDTNVETEATKRKKKAAGKKSLMIGGGGDASGGGTTGTGLNL